MTRCNFFNFLFHAFPLKVIQGYLIKAHFEKCPVCSEELVERDKVLDVLSPQETAAERSQLWSGIQEGLCEEDGIKAPPRFQFRWRWAAGAAGLIFFILAGYWSITSPKRTETAFRGLNNDQIQINYIKVEERPAIPFVYKSQDSEMIFVWAERTP